MTMSSVPKQNSLFNVIVWNPKTKTLRNTKKVNWWSPKNKLCITSIRLRQKNGGSYLIAGINNWRKAFEAAGFKNAIVGKEWPEVTKR